MFDPVSRNAVLDRSFVATSVRPARWWGILLALFSGALVIGAAVAVSLTRHWPMVGDAALLHYSVFLIQHGWAPYRDFTDVNLPGAYAATAAGMLLPFQPDVGWRLFDLSLVAIAGLAYAAIARPHARFAALYATVLLLVIHAQDGVQQAGQRDLVLGVLLVVGVASLIAALRTGRLVPVLGFGAAIGMASTIKPTALPLGLVLLAIAIIARWREPHAGAGPRTLRPITAFAITGLLGMAMAPAGMLVWLWRHGSLAPWLQLERVLLPYYATLDRKPLLFTLSHSLSPIVVLVGLWVLAIAIAPARWAGTRVGRVERLLVAAALVMNLLGLLAQGKALPYQRYPMLAFLLLLLAVDLEVCAIRLAAPMMRRERMSGGLALLGILLGVLVITPLSLWRVSRFDAHRQIFDTMLARDLEQWGGPALNRNVQCMDTIQDCLPTLGELQLEPATGVLSDAELFGPSQQPAVEMMRQRFFSAALVHPPRVIVVVSGSFLDSSSGYAKLERWPEFSSWLAQHYRLAVDRPSPGLVRWWSRPQPVPGYRLYVLREPRTVAEPAPR